VHILLIDDHPIFTQGFRLLLAELDETIQTVVVGSVSALLNVSGPFDLVLLDFHMPNVDGMQLLEMMRQRFENLPIIILSSEENPHVIRQLVAAGASGFIPKSSTPQVLIAALRLILSGGIYLPPIAFDLSLNLSPGHAVSPVQPKSPSGLGLTQRQLEVFLKLVQGKSNKVIARELNLAEATVKTHVSTSFRVLNVACRTEAVYKAAQLGLTLDTPSAPTP
jgi:DNA-binding NarL/FixJ family response regulator